MPNNYVLILHKAQRWPLFWHPDTIHLQLSQHCIIRQSLPEFLFHWILIQQLDLFFQEANMRLSREVEVLLALTVCLGMIATNAGCANNVRSGTSDGSEEWGYIEVRTKAHMFWWFYRSPERKGNSWPLILWLQGGPGASGVAIGNFEEIGPLDTQLKPRKTTWLQKADLLFVDSPVGTGFSYVENTTFAAMTDAQVTEDLLSFLKELHTNSTLLDGPVFIVGESYGGKHASMIALALSQSIAAGQLNVTLGGVALGDSWISPVDYVLSWGSLLKDVSRLEAIDMVNANSIASKIQQQVESGHYGQAADSWSILENFIIRSSNNVDLYNFLLDSGADTGSSLAVSLQSMNSGTPHHYIQYLSSKKNSGENETNVDLNTFMNGVIRKKLKIIPPSIHWGEQSDLVFTALHNDFMKDVIDQVDELLSRGEKVTIYNGQVDLICATIGTESWVQSLKWGGLKGFNSTKRIPIYCNGSVTKGFVKSYKNLRFFWVLGAGHFVPVDQPCVALQMLDMITNAD